VRLPRLGISGARGRKPLAREIAITLAIKLLLLYGLWFLYFSRPAIDNMVDGMDPDRVAAIVVTSPSPSAPSRDPVR
jgi:hypothetical protein